MDEHMIMIPVSLTLDEMTALEVVTQVYLDLLEVVDPLRPDATRMEVESRLFAFRNRCQTAKGERQESTEVPFSIQVPFQELMVATTAIDAYQQMEKIHCISVSPSQMTSMEVITLTRNFQRRMINAQMNS